MKAIFIWVPKVAGTSIYHTLKPHGMAKCKQVELYQGQDVVTFGHMDLVRLMAKGVVSKDTVMDSFVFAFVRNPYDRMVSLYHHYRQHHKVEKGFSAFCRKMKRVNRDIGAYNVRGFNQAAPQSAWIPHGIDYLGRYETLQEDFNTVCDKLGVLPVQLKHKRKSGRRDTGWYYTEETERIVRKLYAEDFERFGYGKM